MKDTREFWSDPKIRTLFLKLCRQSTFPRVNWETFRKNDKKGIFKDFPYPALSMKFRRYNLLDQGLCWYCGKRKSVYSNSLCKICDKIVDENNQRQRNKIKK